MIRQIIAHFSFKERAVFILSLVIFVLGIFSAIIAFSNHFTTIVPRFGGTYREGIIGSPRFINPVIATSDADKDLVKLVYNGLVRIDTNGQIIPDLAQSWEISDDGKTYTFYLKENIFFHDGVQVTTDDILFTLEKINNPTLKSPLRVSWSGVSITTPDKKTVVFNLQKPYSGFLAQTTLGIIPKHIWEKIPDQDWLNSKYTTEPIGSGPYKIKNLIRSNIGIPEQYHLKAFKRFALGKPFIKNVYLISFANKSDALSAFSKNNVDAFAGIDAQDVQRFIDGAHGHVITAPLPRVFGIFLNQNKNKIFSDATVVRALNLATNRTSLIQDMLSGYAHVLQGPLPQSSPETSPDYETQKNLAIRLLDNAGWKVNPETGLREKMFGKEKLTLTFSLATANTPELETSAQQIAEMYASIGVHVDVKVFEIGTLNEHIIRGRDFEALLFGQVIRHDTDIYAFWHSSQKADPGLNITGYTNKRVDNLLESALRETNRDRRFALYETMSQELAKDAPVIFLYTPDFLYLTKQSVFNIHLAPASEPSERFSSIYQWYVYTDRVWNGLVK